MASVTLEALLKKKREVECKHPGVIIDWEGRKDAWLDRVKGLFTDVKGWLEPLLDQKLLEINETEAATLNERYIGLYEVPILEMVAGTDRINLSPVATLIVGSYGRIDMKGPKGRKLMLVLSDTDRPATMRIRVSIGDEILEDSYPSKDADKETRSSTEIIRDDCKWYFVDPVERTRKRLVTREFFEEILMGMFQP